MKRAVLLAVIIVGGWSPMNAQNNRQSAEPETPAAAIPNTARLAAAAVPNVVRFSGAFKNSVGNPGSSGVVGVMLSLYESAEGGTPLWSETQNVELDADGHFTVLLGATRNEGLPLDLFTTGKAR